MAKFGFNTYGAVLTLDHDEVGYAVDATNGGTFLADLLDKVGITGDKADKIKAVALSYFSFQRGLITNKDKGYGIYLTWPYPTLALGQIEFIVIGTRYIDTDAWGRDEKGQLRDEDSDLINFVIQHDAVGTDAVEFVLNSAGLTWRKEIVLLDGMGGAWTIYTEDTKKEDRNGLWLNQLSFGHLTFRKKKFLGSMWDVMDLPIGFLRGGDRVTFYWEKD